MRRWFAAHGLDLIVWVDEADQIVGFQLCYEKKHKEFALTWKRHQGFNHSAVDAGEQLPTRNNTPILVPDGAFDPEFVTGLFERASDNVPEPIRSLVVGALRRYPNA
jgi:hypothetical protein